VPSCFRRVSRCPASALLVVPGLPVRLISYPCRRRIAHTQVARHASVSSYPWVAAGIGLLIWAPNVGWQVAKGFPSLVYIANHQDSGGGLVGNLLLIVVYLFFLIPLWVAGLVSLFRSAVLRPKK
jgi:hypothetical protein